MQKRDDNMLEWLFLALMADKEINRINKLEEDMLDIKRAMLSLAKIELKRKQKEQELLEQEEFGR